MKKGILAGMFTAAAVLLTPLTMLTASAAPRQGIELVISEQSEGDFEYEQIGVTEDGRKAMAITRYHGDELASTIEIPAEIGGGVVTTIRPKIFYVPMRPMYGYYVMANAETLHEIIIPEGVTTIEKNAFMTMFPCDDLTITIPSSVTYIGEKIAGTKTSDENYLEVSRTQLEKYRQELEDYPTEDPELQAIYDNIDWEQTLENGMWIFMKDGQGYAPWTFGIDITTYPDNLKIIGYEGSAAHTFALENNLAFGPLYGEPPLSGSVFAGRSRSLAGLKPTAAVALWGIGGLAVGAGVVLAVLLPKLKKKDGADGRDAQM